MRKRVRGEWLENGHFATHSQPLFGGIAFGWSQCCKVPIMSLIRIIGSYQVSFPALFLRSQDGA